MLFPSLLRSLPFLNRPFFALTSFSLLTLHLSTSTSTPSCSPLPPQYLNATTATALDVSLMNPALSAFTLPQLMELAGLSVAQTIASVYPPSTHPAALVLCGPGNNGGDGLVAARHLVHFGYEVVIVIPKMPRSEHYNLLVKQARSLDIDVLTTLPPTPPPTTVVVDALFGFSYRAPPRKPFDDMLTFLERCATTVSIDIPSGWDVDAPPTNPAFTPSALISLTAPKPCAANFPNRHFVGGRFIPRKVAEEFGVALPDYKGGEQFVEVTKEKEPGPTSPPSESEGWEIGYQQHLDAQVNAQDQDPVNAAGEFVVVYVTAPSTTVADSISEAVVTSKLAACVNQVPGVTSVYAWKGEIERDTEVLMMMKTRRALLKQLEKEIRRLHTYETMEFVVVGVEGGAEDYLEWIRESTK